jgi:hypothetical protein
VLQKYTFGINPLPEKGYRFAEKGCTGIITVYAIVDGLLVAMDITLMVTGHLLRLI